MVFEPELNCSIRPLKSGVRVHSGRSLRRGPGTQTLTRSLLALAQGPPADECSLAPLRPRIKSVRPAGVGELSYKIAYQGHTLRGRWSVSSAISKDFRAKLKCSIRRPRVEYASNGVAR